MTYTLLNRLIDADRHKLYPGAKCAMVHFYSGYYPARAPGTPLMSERELEIHMRRIGIKHYISGRKLILTLYV